MTKNEIMTDPTVASLCFQMILRQVQMQLLEAANKGSDVEWISCKSEYYALLEKATRKVQELGPTEKPLTIVDKITNRFMRNAGININGLTAKDLAGLIDLDEWDA